MPLILLLGLDHDNKDKNKSIKKSFSLSNYFGNNVSMSQNSKYRKITENVSLVYYIKAWVRRHKKITWTC
jgi:hypothetical protein